MSLVTKYFVCCIPWLGLVYFITFSFTLNARSNIPGEVGIYNAQLFYYANRIPFDTSTSTAFLPYIGYLSSNGNPTDYMMDVFILYDLDKSGANSNGHDYDIRKLRTYLDDTFVKARMPYFTDTFHYDNNPSGHSASMELERGVGGGVLQRSINVDPLNTYTLAAYGIIPNAPGQVANSGMMAFEIFDSSGNEIKGTDGQPGLGGTVSWSEYYDIWYTYLNLSQSWQRFQISIELSSEVTSINVQLSLGSGARDYQNQVYYDYAQFVAGDAGYLLSDTELEASAFETLVQDGSFEDLLIDTHWETSGGRYGNKPLFSDRLAAMEGLKQATLSVQNAIGRSSPIKIILMLPHPSNLSNSNINYYRAQLESYLDECLLYFNRWKNDNPSINIDLAGWYFTLEKLFVSDPLWHSFLERAMNLIQNLEGKLYASPYNNSWSPQIKCAYIPEYWSYFDCLWMQPNSWFSPSGSLGNASNVDIDMLRLVGNYVFDNQLGINIERKGNLNDSWSQESNLSYGRLLDYIAYGYHTGYVNLSKCYYDAGGEHWLSAFSGNEIEREQYDELYKFVRTGYVGYISNSDFEQLDDNGQFDSWSGPYNVIGVEEADFIHSQFALGNSENLEAFTTNRISISDSVLYTLQIDAREDGDDGIVNSALIGIEIFDSAGDEIRTGVTGLTWSSVLDMWNEYVPATEQWESYQYEFELPAGSISAKLYLRNWYCENVILWDNVQLLADNVNYSPTSQWNTIFPLNIYENNSPAFISEIIPVSGSGIVDFEVMVRESINDGSLNSALFRLDAYDEQLNLITPDVGNIDGMVWSATDGFWYKYIDIEVTLPIVSPWYESRWIKWQSIFGLPAKARWVRSYVYRWTDAPNNIITFYRPVLTIGNQLSIQPSKTTGQFRLHTNYPNPFNSSTKISYSIFKSDFVTLKIYDILGREIQILISEFQKEGTYIVDFNVTRIPSGIYFYKLEVGDTFVETKKMLLIQ